VARPCSTGPIATVVAGEPLHRVGEAVDGVVEVGEHACCGAVDDRAQEFSFEPRAA
jgi:hypothetical protein